MVENITTNSTIIVQYFAMLKRKVGNYCCVACCNNSSSNSPGTIFYRFSDNKNKLDQRTKWIKAVNRINPDKSLWQPTKYSRICSTHFEGNKKSDHPMSPSFVPTIFPARYLTKKMSKSSMQRYQRSLKKEPDSNIATIDEYLAEEPPCLPPNIVCNDESTQVDFWDDRREESLNIFICSRIVYEEKCELGKNVLFVMPPFLRSDYFTAEEVQETREVANLRIHIERIMSRIKTYQIVSKFTIKMLPYADTIILMSCILVNLQPPILKVDKGESDDT